MPRVNRDLQRRLAARRERERRRPTERRYNFATTEPELLDTVDTDAAAQTDTDFVDGEVDTELASSAAAERAPGSTRGSGATTATSSSTSTAARGNARSTYRPFSDYKEEYAYVYRDLRRVAVVVGGLLIALLVLYFALPLLAH